jgi:hypothetical protein
VIFAALSASACSRKRIGRLEAASKAVLDLEKTYTDAPEPAPNHAQELADIYQRELKPALAVADGCSKGCLDGVFESLATVSFYTKSPDAVSDQEKVFLKIAARGTPPTWQLRQMRASYVLAREFDKARGLEKSLPAGSFDSLPEIVGAPRGTGPRIYRIEHGGNIFRVDRAALEGARIVIVAHPLCGFSRKAMAAIEADHRLMAAMADRTILVAAPKGALEVSEFLRWNRSHPSFPMHPIHAVSDWPGVDDWGSTPIFYFMRDGKLVDKLYGWQTAESKEGLRAGLMRLGLL